MIDRKTLLILVAAFAVGYFASGPSSPTPQPPDRPVLRWIAKAAKNLLWIAIIADPPPASPTSERHLVHAPPVGADGYQVVDHGKGW